MAVGNTPSGSRLEQNLTSCHFCHFAELWVMRGEARRALPPSMGRCGWLLWKAWFAYADMVVYGVAVLYRRWKGLTAVVEAFSSSTCTAGQPTLDVRSLPITFLSPRATRLVLLISKIEATVSTTLFVLCLA
ncbi:hypothetical protein EJ06DRAFT_149010 [Trichodelitschia bisporula]|uniref:Uncharacterized protein n=1 Tax=Trichodelitschia bisporula TaxID=703511 RepID=A0A6G1HMY7_9PEZI|nr:hypothetical protein EJ06DRAFT_149010 [Trichodelitschia bisporula]